MHPINTGEVNNRVASNVFEFFSKISNKWKFVLIYFMFLLFIGYGFLFSRILFPAEYTGGPQFLSDTYQALYVHTIAELYSYQGDQQKVLDALNGWGGDTAACQLAMNATVPADAARLEAVAGIVNSQGCSELSSTSSTSGDNGNGIDDSTIILSIFVVFVLPTILIASKTNIFEQYKWSVSHIFISAILSIFVGWVIGLVIGWSIYPGSFDLGPQNLTEPFQAQYVRSVAELYSYQGDQQKVLDALNGWKGDVVACQLAVTATDPGDAARLIAIAYVVNGVGCPDQEIPLQDN